MSGLKHHIIGLCGYAGAGKDTVGDLLATHAGFRKIAFADALRDELVEAFHVERMVFTRAEFKHQPMAELALERTTSLGFIGAVLQHLGETEPGVPVAVQLKLGRTPRQVMQWWGTQYRRRENTGYWTRIVRDSITDHMRQGHEHNFVVTDVRFDNEATTLRNMGGVLWQVPRTGVDAATTPEGTHESATDGAEFAPEVVIPNTGTLRELQQAVLGAYWAADAGLQRVVVEIA